MPDTNYISEYVIEEPDGQMRPMTYLKATVEVPESRLKEIDHYLNDEPASADDCLSEDDTIIYTARFADGYEMDIKCCGVQFHDGPDETNTAWCEAVLFKRKRSCQRDRRLHVPWYLDTRARRHYLYRPYRPRNRQDLVGRIAEDRIDTL